MKRKMAMGLRNRPENAGRAQAIDEEDSKLKALIGEQRGWKEKRGKENRPKPEHSDNTQSKREEAMKEKGRSSRNLQAIS